MLRRLCVLSACLVGFATPAIAQDRPAPRPDMVPDLSWNPRPGDIAVIYSSSGGECVATRDLATLLDLAKSGKANDATGVRELLDSGSLVMLPHMARVRVIERNDLALVARGILVLEIRVESGEHLGEKLWTLQPYVARLMRRPEPALRNEMIPGSNLPTGKNRPVPKSAPPKPVDPATRAAGALQTGKNLRFAGNRAAAIESFRKAIATAPESPAAIEARATLKAMGVE